MTEVVRLSYKGRYVTGLIKDARKWRYFVTPSDQHMIVRKIPLNARGVEPLFFKEEPYPIKRFIKLMNKSEKDGYRTVGGRARKFMREAS
jgi:hypothetical protein